MNNKTLYLFFITMFTFTTAVAQTQFSKEVFESKSGDTLLYRQLNPLSIEPNTTYPLVLFLHGAGERGNDNEAQLQHGANMFTNPVNQEKYPTFALFPQCPADSYWAPVNRGGAKDDSFFPYDAPMPSTLQSVKELLDQFINNNPVDTDRIYIVGLSMGGMGTFEMVCRYPTLFSVAIPICGGVNTKRLAEVQTSTSFRIYHGDADAVVPVTFSREAYTTLKALNADVEYIEFPGINHDSWTPAFNMPDFMEWLFEQSK